MPRLGLYPRVFGLNPRGAVYKAAAAFLPGMGVRKEYFDLMDLLKKHCPHFNTYQLEKRKNAPADRRHGGRQRLRNCIRL